MAGLLMLVLGFWASFKLKDPPDESAHPADQKAFSSVQSKANPLSPVVQTKPSQDVKSVIPTQSPPKPHNFSVADGGDAKPLDNSQAEAKYRRWSLIAKGSHLNLLGEEDLSLNEAVIALLETQCCKRGNS
jgi:hypothetical protein